MRDFEVPQMILEKWEKEFISYTLPETNMAPENTPLEKEIPIGNHHFWVRTVSFREGIVFFHVLIEFLKNHSRPTSREFRNRYVPF